MYGEVQIIKGDALDLPLNDATVDLIVTSPPYFNQRSYTDEGEHYEGQIGSEAKPGEYVDSLIAATREMVRVLKPSGSIWVNLGDKYASSGGHKGIGASSQRQGRSSNGQISRSERNQTGIATKSLIGTPWRYAIRCVDELDLILRAEVIWHKTVGLPESVTDRVRRSHEVWFHFTKSQRYFAAVDEIREAHECERDRGSGPRFQVGTGRNDADAMRAQRNPLGKLPGSVWDIATQPLIVPPELGIDHWAAFPMEWPRRIIKGWSPTGICTACGEGRRPVVTHQRTFDGQPLDESVYGDGPTSFWKDGRTLNKGVGNWRFGSEREIVGYTCACADATAPTVPAVVLDPFGGTGTTALVAKVLGRTGISVDLSADYGRLAEWRVNDPVQIAAAAEQPKPVIVKPIEGQVALFD